MPTDRRGVYRTLVGCRGRVSDSTTPTRRGGELRPSESYGAVPFGESGHDLPIRQRAWVGRSRTEEAVGKRIVAADVCRKGRDAK